MHLIMIVTALSIACLIRLLPLSRSSWEKRWQRTLFLYLFPPLIIVATILAVLLMGAQGEMMGMKATQFSYGFSLIFFLALVLNSVYLWLRAMSACKKVSLHPVTTFGGSSLRLINSEFPYVAQIGLWQPVLVASSGLIKLLNKSQLEAVLAHEEAHLYYRDNFCFFLLGLLRRCIWLPNTETIWEELLLLREIRADLKAAETVDPLIIAESLLAVAQAPTQTSCWEVGFSLPSSNSRLAQRVEALIDNDTLPKSPNWAYWSWLMLLFIPLATVPLHC